MKPGLTLRAYGVFMRLAQHGLRSKLARRGRQEPGYVEAIEERFGHYRQPPGQGYVWVHAVSLGETRTAALLIAQLRADLPGCRLLLTHGTATGRSEGLTLLREGDVQVWLPWDTWDAVQRFVAHFRPRIGILMETEVWPNLVAVCRQQAVPLVLVNARLSEKSLRHAQRLAALSRPAYRGLAAVYAQTEADALRLRLLGAPLAGVFGNLKFDATPDAAQLARARAWRRALTRPVLIFASSREGEEKLLLEQLRGTAGAVQWLIVPRHPQRFAEVAALVAQCGLSLSRRSEWQEGPIAADVWLGDSMAEMALYYGLADVALLGGSFAKLGGQNLIEAAACGCPVVMGPHTFNFLEAAELGLAAGAAFRAEDMATAVALATTLALDRPRHDAAVAACEHFALVHRGALHRTAQALLGLL